MLAGMAASAATAKGLNGIEAGAKKLAKPKLGDVRADGGAVLYDADIKGGSKENLNSYADFNKVVSDIGKCIHVLICIKAVAFITCNCCSVQSNFCNAGIQP